MLDVMDFDGSPYKVFEYDEEGLSAKEAFYLFDSQGKTKSTKEPELLSKLFKTKGSVNFHIKMYAESRAEGTLSGLECRAACIKYKMPNWFRQAIEKQKWKYYE